MKDFTIKNEHRASIRFDSGCICNIYINMDSKQIVTEVLDNPEDKRYIATADLEEQEG